MQLKGLVRIFAILLIVICLWTLSYTLFVRNHENAMGEKASSWVKRNYPSATEDEKKTLTEDRLRVVLDSTKNTKIGPFGFTTYKEAKDKELALGLDLQGGMSVTMEVGMDGLIKSLAEAYCVNTVSLPLYPLPDTPSTLAAVLLEGKLALILSTPFISGSVVVPSKATKNFNGPPGGLASFG